MPVSYARAYMPTDYTIIKQGSTYKCLDGRSRNVKNDTAADIVIQHAIDALAGTGHIHIKTAEYDIGAIVDVDQDGINITGANWGLYGTGDGTRLKQINNVNLDKILNITGDNFQMSDIFIDGNLANNATANDGIYTSNAVHDAVLQNIAVKSAKRHGFNVYANTSKYINCVGEYCGGNGFNGNSPTRCEFINISAVANVAAGLYLTGASDGTLIMGSRFIANESYHVKLQGTTSADYFRIFGCIFRNNAGEGLEGLILQGAKYNIITGNTFEDCCQGTDDTYECIKLYDQGARHSTYNIITGNVIFSDAANQPKWGISEHDANQDYNIIKNNIITGCVTADIDTNGVNSIVSDNI